MFITHILCFRVSCFCVSEFHAGHSERAQETKQKKEPVVMTTDRAAVHSQKAVFAHFTSKQILPFGFAEQ